jgi:hypothetical protein
VYCSHHMKANLRSSEFCADCEPAGQ